MTGRPEWYPATTDFYVFGYIPNWSWIILRPLILKSLSLDITAIIKFPNGTEFSRESDKRRILLQSNALCNLRS